MLRIGVIGYGSRISKVVGTIRSLDVEARLAAVADPQTDAISGRLKENGFDGVSVYPDADQMLDAEGDRLAGVLVGTRDMLHARMGIKVLDRDISLFREKPAGTTFEDLKALADAGRRTGAQTVVSFPLRVTPHVEMAKQIIESGKIGSVEYVSAWNNPGNGSDFYQGWFRDESGTRGLFLQKACHDFDYINYLLGIAPRSVCAAVSKQVFKGDRPAGLRCVDCDERDICLESPFHPSRSGAAGRSARRRSPRDVCCAFAEDTGNEDSGSAIIEYETGMHVSYSQCFYARRDACGRGARLCGHKGTITFDWYDDELSVFMHHAPEVIRHKFDTLKLSHHGGDLALSKSFIDVMRGSGESVAPLDAGLVSVLMCLEARESAQSRTFREIDFTDVGM